MTEMSQSTPDVTLNDAVDAIGVALALGMPVPICHGMLAWNAEFNYYSRETETFVDVSLPYRASKHDACVDAWNWVMENWLKHGSTSTLTLQRLRAGAETDLESALQAYFAESGDKLIIKEATIASPVMRIEPEHDEWYDEDEEENDD